MHTVFVVYLALLGVERLAEMVVSRRNARLALSQGGVEVGQAHFRLMTLLHAGFFAGCVAEVVLLDRPFLPFLGWPMLILAIAAQGLRYWAIASLGRRWNVRVIVLPGAPVVRGGPYRLVRHPNYLAVVIEGVVVPLIHTAYLTAVVFTLLNAWMLRTRIRCEERALSEHADYAEAFGQRARFVPKTGVNLLI